MLLATARFVITTIQRKFLYFFVFFFPKVPRSIHFQMPLFPALLCNYVRRSLQKAVIVASRPLFSAVSRTISLNVNYSCPLPNQSQMHSNI